MLKRKEGVRSSIQHVFNDNQSADYVALEQNVFDKDSIIFFHVKQATAINKQ